MFSLLAELLYDKQTFLKGGSLSKIEARISTVAATGVPGLISMFGGDTDRVLGAARLRLSDLGDPAGLLNLQNYCDLFEQAARQTGVDSFGLRFGQAYRIENMGSLGQIALHSPSLGVALRNLCRYFPAVQEHSRPRLADDGDLVRLEYQIRDGRIAQRRQDAELTIGIFSNLFRLALGAAWSPAEVHFEHPRAADLQEMHGLLRAPVYFGMPVNAIVFRGTALAAPMPGANPLHLPALHAALTRQVSQAGPASFHGLVMHEIRAGFARGDAGIDAVANSLGMTRTMLYRRLQTAGLDFTTLTQTVRQELAVLYVPQPHIPLGDIAAILGYSELSAFSRAFRRWTGAAPAQYRERG